ncbi:hypothetical protein EV188_103723 [Actinomycetospora succinea]|uniref:PE family protein n=1 Tax=Actinomycetospora succinea TaxID=663603 RepID=A0A4R6VIM4_9PSEU|nr:hypothetical protein [Actinomycetospora succinea]TDQ61216.1 hypothetical protein EV188_103723 [Actinomycetospora succinea]
MTQPVPVGGGSFTVDISRAPDAIRELEQAKLELEGIKRDAVYLGQVAPPTNDLVTLDAARVLGDKAAVGPTSFISALTQGIEEISRMIEALRLGFAEYERTDDDARTELA